MGIYLFVVFALLSRVQMVISVADLVTFATTWPLLFICPTYSLQGHVIAAKLDDLNVATKVTKCTFAAFTLFVSAVI